MADYDDFDDLDPEEQQELLAALRQQREDAEAMARERGYDPLDDNWPVIVAWYTCQLHKMAAHTCVHCMKYEVFGPKQRVAYIHCQ